MSPKKAQIEIEKYPIHSNNLQFRRCLKEAGPPFECESARAGRSGSNSSSVRVDFVKSQRIQKTVLDTVTKL